MLHYFIPNKDLLSFTFLISPKESEMFYRICVVAQSEQSNIRHPIFPRDYTALYVPKGNTAPYNPYGKYGPVYTLWNIQHRLPPCFDWATTLYRIFESRS